MATSEDTIRCPRCSHVTNAHYVVKARRSMVMRPIEMYCPQCGHRWKPRRFTPFSDYHELDR